MKTGGRAASSHGKRALLEDEEETGAAALVSVAPGEQPLSAEQRKFNRLNERVRRQREMLAAWEAYAPRFRSRVAAELEPLERELRALQRRLVRRLDELLAAPREGERLSRGQRAKARAQILALVDELLQEGADAELEVLYDRHGELSRSERRRMRERLAEELMGDVFGAEANAFCAKAAAQADEAQDARDEGAAPGDGDRAKRARDANRSVREIYRRLATALHPDREPGAAKRERKTRLMQRANRAYESDDLLELLALQIEIGEIDARALASVPDERLRQYNKALREQMWSLEEQVRQHAWTYREALGIRSYRLTPEDTDRALTARVAEARALRRTLERDLQALDDPRRRRAFFDALPEPREAEEPGFDELAALAAVFGSPGRKPRAGRRRKRH
jgi:hypothetical protein